MMKTLILNGSPRRNGDTVSLLNILKEELSGEIVQIDAYFADIAPCTDCRFCRTNEGCAVSDEMDIIYNRMFDCDNVVIASPIYFSEVTGKLLDVCSRLQTYYSARFFRGERVVFKQKKGAVILVGGGDGRPDRAEATARTLLKHMGCTEQHPLVLSHDTDRQPAADDIAAVDGVKSVARFFNARTE